MKLLFYLIIEIVYMSEGRFSMPENTNITREMCSVVYGFRSSDG